MKMQKRIAVVIMLCMLGCTFPALAEGMESGALMESRNTAQSTADRINDLERFFANELQGIKLTRYCSGAKYPATPARAISHQNPHNMQRHTSL